MEDQEPAENWWPISFTGDRAAPEEPKPAVIPDREIGMAILIVNLETIKKALGLPESVKAMSAAYHPHFDMNYGLVLELKIQGPISDLKCLRHTPDGSFLIRYLFDSPEFSL